MNWTVVTVGKPRLEFARLGVEDYAGRLSRTISLQLVHVPASDPDREGEALLRQSAGRFRVLLDEKGTKLTSRAFAEKISAWEQDRVKSVALLLGGANGHGPAMRAAADWQWSLGPLTLQHELALVVVLEQLYRAYAIKAGAPYHRD